MFKHTSPHHPSIPHVAEVELHYLSKVRPSDRLRVCQSIDAYRILMNGFDLRKIEHKEMFFCLYLNNAGRVLSLTKISEGGITATVADTRIIFQYALRLNATAFVISHNHPSGYLQPSSSDDSLTHILKESGRILSITLKDHIIVSPDLDRYFSYADEGRL